MKDLPESDWKLLRLMKDTLLRRASRTALDRVKGIVIGQDDDPHKIYLALWDTLKTEDSKIGRMFDNMKRSTAILNLAEMIRNELIREDELQGFTEETKERAKEIANQVL